MPNNLSRLVVAPVACLLLACLLCAGLARAQSVNQEALTEQAKRLEKIGEAWLKKGQLDENQEDYRDELRALKAVTYDADSLTGLQAVINAPRQAPIDLFVANRMLRPLLGAKTDVIRKALPMIKSFLQRAGAFRDLPVYSDETLQAYRYPEGATEGQKAVVDELRRRKLEKEMPIKLHNQQVSELQRLLFDLMAMANEEKTDSELFALMRSTENRGWWAWSQIAETVRSECKHMSKDRAKALYLDFERLWNELREDMDQKKQPHREYVDHGEITLREDANSTFAVVKDNPSPRLLRTINHLAPIARMPALKDPKGRNEAPGAQGKQPPTPGGGSKRQPPAPAPGGAGKAEKS